MSLTLTTARLTLRPPQPDDVAGYIAYAATARAEALGGPHAAPRAWHDFTYQMGHWQMRGYGLFTVLRRDTTIPIGQVGPYFAEGLPEAELGWHLWSAADEGQGLAFEAASTARDFCHARLGWRSCVSYVPQGNLRSEALATRLGAVLDPAAATPEAGLRVYRHTLTQGAAA